MPPDHGHLAADGMWIMTISRHMNLSCRWRKISAWPGAAPFWVNEKNASGAVITLVDISAT